MLYVLAADGHEAASHSGSPTAIELLPLISSLVIFALFFLVLAKVVWPRITQGLDDRQNKIREEIASAEAAREQAKAALEEYESSLSTARQEASDMIAKAKGDARAAAEELRDRNQRELSDMKQRAQQEIEGAKRAAIAELHAEASTLASAVAGKILQREISADDQQRLVDEALRELGNLQEA